MRAFSQTAIVFATLLALVPRLANADDAGDAPMTAEQFDAFSLGKTLDWMQYGQIYGVEEYLPGHRVRWRADGDICEYGT